MDGLSVTRLSIAESRFASLEEFWAGREEKSRTKTHLCGSISLREEERDSGEKETTANFNSISRDNPQTLGKVLKKVEKRDLESYSRRVLTGLGSMSLEEEKRWRWIHGRREKEDVGIFPKS